MKMTGDDDNTCEVDDLPLDWPLILEELKQEYEQEEDPVVSIVIAGYAFKVANNSDVQVLIDALSAIELPESPFPLKLNDEEGPEDDDPGPIYA